MNKYFLFLTLLSSAFGIRNTNAHYPYLNKLDENSLLRCACNAEDRWLPNLIVPSRKKEQCDILEKNLKLAATKGHFCNFEGKCSMRCNGIRHDYKNCQHSIISEILIKNHTERPNSENKERIIAEWEQLTILMLWLQSEYQQHEDQQKNDKN
jgi:hypothetical protein